MRWTISSTVTKRIRCQLSNRPIILLSLLFLLMACTGHQTEREWQIVDSLNDRAHAWQYRNIDSLHATATLALKKARDLHYADGEAEALNHLMAERFQQMDFDSAAMLADHVSSLTQNQIELLVADIMQMRIAQRTSDNRAFFIHRSHALRRVRRIAEEEAMLTPHMTRRFNVARSDLHIVSSTYFYYVDQQERALAEIRAAEPLSMLPGDTAQWLYYCYMRGSGGLSDFTAPEDITRDEFDYLFKCFTLAKNHGYLFFQANAAQSLATLFADSTRRAIVRDYKPNAEDYLLSVFGADSTAQHMGEVALERFTQYDDLYQEACALRTLGELDVEAGRYESAIDHFAAALSCVNFHHLCYYAADEVLMPDSTDALLSIFEPQPDTISVERRWMQSAHIKTVPEWIAGIRQQLSVAFSALDLKAESDYNRNIYLDLLEATREDAELESRYIELQEDSRRLHWALFAVVCMAVVIIVLVLVLRRAWRHRSEQRMRLLRQELQQSMAQAERKQEQLEEEQEQLREQQQATQLRIQRDKQRNIEKRAKLQLVHGITPFLDRIIHETQKMQRQQQVNPESLTYINELTDRITAYNDLLTDWIQMEQGQLTLQLSSFPLQPLFDTIAKNHYSFDQKQLTLDVQPTDLIVKADRTLTFFMLNTLADNARKFTPAGGRVTITATAGQTDDGAFVELAVQDTGVGLAAQDISLILNNKVYDAATIGKSSTGTAVSHRWETSFPPVGNAVPTDGNLPDRQKGFGFGLMNCKGIIEKYRKTAALFRVCHFGIESRVGEGARFFFRLPRVMTLFLVALSGLSPSFAAPSLFTASPATVPAGNLSPSAYRLADSVYFCNLAGRYTDAIVFADSALAAINSHTASHADNPRQRLTLRASMATPTEIIWWQQHKNLDYSLILGLRNEIAVAALALHDWPLYRYNNHVYTRLFKLSNQDASLETYCQQIERSQANLRVALVLFVLLLALGLAATWLFYFRPQLRYRQTVTQLRRRRHEQLMSEKEHHRQEKEQTVELAEDEVRRRLYEEGRLHVQNQIIDNCLSTIKHETMYYPGRIQQLVSQMMAAPVTPSPSVTVPEDSPSGSPAASLLSTLAETAAYYKEVFTLLAAQADSQSAAVAFRRRRIPIGDLVDTARHRYAIKTGKAAVLEVSTEIDQPAAVLGDPDQLSLLFDSLFEAECCLSSLPAVEQNSPFPATHQSSPLSAAKQSSSFPSAGTPSPSTPQLSTFRSTLVAPHLENFQLSTLPTPDSRFARFTIHNPTVTLSPEALHDFFMPRPGGIPALIAKQIIREHDTFLGHPGCRITAEAAQEGHLLWFTLPLIDNS